MMRDAKRLQIFDGTNQIQRLLIARGLLKNTAEEAAAAVAACRYPPVGMRSSGPLRAALYGGSNYQAEANDEMAVLAMIETGVSDTLPHHGREVRHG